MREAFEAHWYDLYHAGSIKAQPNGTYMAREVQKSWDAWQAATERATQVERERCAVICNDFAEQKRLGGGYFLDKFDHECEGHHSGITYAKAIRQGGAG
ncbi:MAG: hypothetical protein K2X64_12175 [Rhodocyclaceae bacterium]|nr:hypothetical protein [Rhodocyclaceae bacterium]